MLTQALQALSPALDGVMKFFSFLGTVEFYILLIPFIYWIVDASLGMRAMWLLLITDFFGVACKQLFRQPRPYWISDVKAIATETSYGLVSTHASDSLAVWGLLAVRIRKNWLWVLSTVLVILIGISRLYLGVHFLTDVLGGWAIGIITILGLTWFEKSVFPTVSKGSPSKQTIIGFGMSLIVICTGLLIHALTASSTDPAAWANFSMLSRSLTQYFTLAGTLFGSISGYALMRSMARFQTKGILGQKIGRYLLGIVGVLVLYFGLDTLFSLVAVDESSLGYILRYIRYGAVTFWAAFGAPWAFLKLNLASKRD